LKNTEMLPEKFIRRIEHQDYINAGELLMALEEQSPVSIRINKKKWGKIPLGSDPVPWCGDGHYIAIRPSFTLDPLFHAGCYYPQEASGMFLEQAFIQSTSGLSQIRVLDLCGAPGGKSTHLSSLIGDKGLLVANEVIRSRAGILSETLTKWGEGNAIVTQNDPGVFGRLKGYFDLILVDAPCSGEGMFRNKEAVKEWSVENTLLCSERQKRILMDVWPALKANGILIYSTCTFNPPENEHNLFWLAERKEAESLKLDIPDLNGITLIDYKGIRGYGFLPGKTRGEGFFLAALRKTEKAGQNLKMSRIRSGPALTREELAVMSQWTDINEEKLIKNGNEISGTAVKTEELQFLMENLRVIKGGTRICTVKNRDYLPAHELAFSLRMKRDAFPSQNLKIEQALSFLRRDLMNLHDAPEGWLLIKYEGINLGFAKKTGNRINNYYPVNWRIRMIIPANVKESILRW
jgi:16S rRNA C967 or C1407 C5-methylase (RsmB/RsmF family)/NOL1/NOP2/fmu family ribosome biogenesis protein